MKRKYYLRGLGLGILITALVFTIAGPKELSDEEIINRAEKLGYVKEEDASLGIKDLLDKETPVPTPTEEPTPTETPIPTLTSAPTETPVPTPTVTPVPTNTPIPQPTATVTPVPTNTPIPQPTATVTPTNTPTPQPTEEPEEIIKAVIVVERGNSASMVCDKLKQEGIVKDGKDFRNYLRSLNLTDYINIGTYD